MISLQVLFIIAYVLGLISGIAIGIYVEEKRNIKNTEKKRLLALLKVNELYGKFARDKNVNS